MRPAVYRAGDPALRALFPRGCLAHVLGRTRVFSLRAAL